MPPEFATIVELPPELLSAVDSRAQEKGEDRTSLLQRYFDYFSNPMTSSRIEKKLLEGDRPLSFSERFWRKDFLQRIPLEPGSYYHYPIGFTQEQLPSIMDLSNSVHATPDLAIAEMIRVGVELGI